MLSVFQISYCKRDNSEKLSFLKNEQNGMIRFQAFIHGKIETNETEKYYNFVLKQAENLQGVFQIDSTNSELRIRLIQVDFPFNTETDCTNTNSGNTYSCKIEIKPLEKASYRLRVFRNSKTEESSFNLFAGIFGNGYVHIE
ncbi:hypothetical protein CH380_20280 [Leptospira adleri]|uniref:Uncharacterized protein n=2 Tax=Leptospira adleri TaxID=2023186 RepID=A0A2M9YIV0_9LEPT|nr:hypothetical protein CH380_20280 [Leptospira adleri]PJZ63376.1 hypothetical protein CH376_03365 [Leptospira adleri]